MWMMNSMATRVKKWAIEARVPLAMLLVQLIATVLQILSKLILTRGAAVYAVIVYRHILAAFCVLPFALYFERGVMMKKITWKALCLIFSVALAGISMAMGLFYYGMKETSATYATFFFNFIPIVTFVLAIILRMERVRLKTLGGKLKSVGASVCLAGALTIAFYTGYSFNIPSPFHHHHHHHHHLTSSSSNSSNNHENNSRKRRGSVFLMSSCLCYSVWFILQVKMWKVFPYKYSATLMTCVWAAVQGAAIGVVLDPNPRHWALSWNLELITILYSAIFATAATFCLVTWGISQKGPTYVAMFNPLSLIFVTPAEAFFLSQKITLGSLIGMSLILVGLYAFQLGVHHAAAHDAKTLPPPPPPPPQEEC